MKATPSDQLQILDVQRMDFHVATLTNKAAALPEIAELLTTTNRLQVVRDLCIAAQTQISDIKRELSRSEGDVEQVVTRLERDEKRLNDGSTAAKDLERLQHEVATLAGRRAELEEIELEIMMRIDSVKERLEELRAEETILVAQAEEIGARKDAALGVITADIAATSAERLATVQGIDGALVDLYEKIRSNGGNGAAAFRGGTCEGCHLPVNSVEIGRIKTAPSDEVVRCEECRCILVRGAQ
ncbi:MAG: C4-type zinc ribbon domain-containing protein [Actinomycetes bacterium]